jgi:hypothetical protein
MMKRTIMSVIIVMMTATITYHMNRKSASMICRATLVSHLPATSAGI